jgi:hypothetical protein
MFVDPSKLSSQATLITIVYSLIGAFSLVYAFLPPFSWGRLFAFLMWVGFTIVTVYDTNCLAASCPQWCTIRTTLYCLVPILLLIVAIAKSFANSDGDNAGQICIMSV